MKKKKKTESIGTILYVSSGTPKIPVDVIQLIKSKSLEKKGRKDHGKKKE